MSEEVHRGIEVAHREVEAARVLMAQMATGSELACVHLERAVRALATATAGFDPSDSPWHAVENELIPPEMRSRWKSSAAVVARCADCGVDQGAVSMNDLDGAARAVCDLVESALIAASTRSKPSWGGRSSLVKVFPGALAMVILSAAIWIYSAMTSPAARARARVPRIVLVSIDTLHVNRTGPYNQEIDFTPFLNRFADGGTRFAHAYTHTANSRPSHATLMTGISPASLGVMTNSDRMADDADTLAEILFHAGYRTAAFVSLPTLGPASGITQGFEDVDGPFTNVLPRPYRRADEVFESVQDWLREHQKNPFFIWVHFSDPQAPYVPEDTSPDTELWLDGSRQGRYSIAGNERHIVTVELPPGKHELRWISLHQPRSDDRSNTGLELLLEQSNELSYYAVGDLPAGYTPLGPEFALKLSNQERESIPVELAFMGRLRQSSPSVVLTDYDVNVAHTDLFLGKLADLIGKLGEPNQTLLIIVSDHGEGLFAHDTTGHAEHVYEDQTRVLWMMQGPDIPKGHVVDERPALLMDVAPTVLAILGIGGRGMEGRSLVGCWNGSSCPESEPWWAFGISVSQNTRGLTSMASYRWPYKWLWRRNMERTAFDLATDPWEEQDLLAVKGNPIPEPLKQSAEAFRAERQYLGNVLQTTAQKTDSAEQY